MTELSRSAEWVLNAVTLKRYDVPYQACPKSIDQIRSDVAAALRAVADQVAPENYSCYENDRAHDFGMETRNDDIREAILKIADELEGADD